MNFAQHQHQFKKTQVQGTLKLQKLTRMIFHLVIILNRLDGIILKLLCVVWGFQYDIYIQLHAVGFDNEYLIHAEHIESHLKITLPLIGE